MLKKEWMRLAIERGDALNGLRESYAQLEAEIEQLVVIALIAEALIDDIDNNASTRNSVRRLRRYLGYLSPKIREMMEPQDKQK